MDGEGSIFTIIEGLVVVDVQVESEFGQGCSKEEILNLKVWIDGLEGGTDPQRRSLPDRAGAGWSAQPGEWGR